MVVGVVEFLSRVLRRDGVGEAMGLDKSLVPFLIDLFDGDLLEGTVAERTRALGAAAAISGLFD